MASIAQTLHRLSQNDTRKRYIITQVVGRTEKVYPPMYESYLTHWREASVWEISLTAFNISVDLGPRSLPTFPISSLQGLPQSAIKLPDVAE